MECAKINHKTRKKHLIALGILKSIKRKNKLYKTKIHNPSTQNNRKFKI